MKVGGKKGIFFDVDFQKWGSFSVKNVISSKNLQILFDKITAKFVDFSKFTICM